MPYELLNLAYSEAALEPHIDARTMQIHHGKHHQGYVTKLNAALKEHGHATEQEVEALIKNLDALPEELRTAVRNNGGGHANHTLFWDIMSPEGGSEPGGKLAEAIGTELGGFDAFREAFSNAAKSRFGSGWAWLGVKGDGSLCVCSTPNQDSPLMQGVAECPCTPILGLDVWEHAYYLHYQNRRPDYIEAWWNIVNWARVEERYLDAAG